MTAHCNWIKCQWAHGRCDRLHQPARHHNVGPAGAVPATCPQSQHKGSRYSVCFLFVQRTNKFTMRAVHKPSKHSFREVLIKKRYEQNLQTTKQKYIWHNQTDVLVHKLATLPRQQQDWVVKCQTVVWTQFFVAAVCTNVLYLCQKMRKVILSQLSEDLWKNTRYWEGRWRDDGLILRLWKRKSK